MVQSQSFNQSLSSFFMDGVNCLLQLLLLEVIIVELGVFDLDQDLKDLELLLLEDILQIYLLLVQSVILLDLFSDPLHINSIGQTVDYRLTHHHLNLLLSSTCSRQSLQSSSVPKSFLFLLYLYTNGHTLITLHPHNSGSLGLIFVEELFFKGLIDIVISIESV